MARYGVALWVACALTACADNHPASPPVSDSAPVALSDSSNATFVFHSDGATRFECQLDLAPAVACTSPYTITVADGSHTMTITAFVGSTPVPGPLVITWLVDTTPPDTTITSSPAAVDNSLTTSFSFIGVPASDTARFECALDLATFAACASPSSITTTAGTHVFYVRAVDLASNVDPTPAQYMWLIDTALIDTTIVTGPAMDSTTQGDVAFTFTSTEPLATFECQIDAASYAPCTSPAQFSGLAEASHTFSVRARHGTEVDPTPATRTWTVDLTAPPITITQTPPAESNDSTPTFGFSSTDATATFDCEIDGLVAYASCTSPWTSPLLFQGSRTFRVRATDPAGNSAVAVYTWDLDVTPPIVSIDSYPGSGTTNPTATFQFSVLEPSITFECEIDGVVAYTPCTSPWSYVVPGGTQTFHVRATDLAGNQGSATWSWLVNLPGPTVVITSGPPAIGNSTTAQFTFTTAGAVAVLDCSMDGGAYTVCTSPATYSGLLDGAHVFVVRVRDAMSNTYTASQSFTINTALPSITPWFGPPAVTRDRHPVVGWTIGPTVVTSTVYVDGAGGQVNSPPGVYETSRPPMSLDSTPVNPLADGPHTITARVWDSANNYSDYTWSFTVDATGPSVSLDSTPSGTTAVATFTFSSTDAVGFDCQLDNVAWTPCTSPFNALVADGVHTFRVRGNDAYGNHTIKLFTWANQGDPMVATPVGSYDNGQTITVSWNGLPGNVLDWIAIAPQGSSDTTITQRIYTGGAVSGSTAFAGVTTNGSYVARAFVNDTFTKLAESNAFAVSSPCAPLAWGPAVTILNAADATSLAPYTSLGNLRISPTADFAVTLPCLETVNYLTIDDGGGAHPLLALHAPRLRTTSGDVSVTNGPPIFDTPALTSIAGILRFTQDTLPDLAPLRRLQTFSRLEITSANGVVGPLDFAGVTTLATFSGIPLILMNGGQLNGFNNLTTVTGPNPFWVSVTNLGGLNGLVSVPGAINVTASLNGGLKSLSTVVGDATFNMSGGPTVTLPSLDTVSGSLWIYPTGSTIQSIQLPSLRKTFRLLVDGTTGTGMTTFDAPLLTDVYYDVELLHMGLLPVCIFYNLMDQLYPTLSVYNANQSLQYGDDSLCTFNY